MQEFHIIHGSVNPTLEMEVIEDGRYSFHRSLINDALQDSTVTFSMRDESTGLLQISKSPANIVLAMNESCEEKYILQYKWKIFMPERAIPIRKVSCFLMFGKNI